MLPAPADVAPAPDTRLLSPGWKLWVAAVVLVLVLPVHAERSRAVQVDVGDAGSAQVQSVRPDGAFCGVPALDLGRVRDRPATVVSGDPAGLQLARLSRLAACREALADRLGMAVVLLLGGAATALGQRRRLAVRLRFAQLNAGR